MRLYSLYNNFIVHSYSAVEIVVVRNPTDMDPRNYHDLKAYMEGAMAYITAAWNEEQIQSNLVPDEFTIGDGSSYGGYSNVPLKSNTQYGYFIRYMIENDANVTNVRCYLILLTNEYMIFLL